MVALAQVLQQLQTLPQTLDAALPALESAGRASVQRALSALASTGSSVVNSSVAQAGMGAGADIGFDRAVAGLDPAKEIHSKTFSVEGFRQDLNEEVSRIVHAAESQEDRRRREPTGPDFVPMERKGDLFPWSKSQPMMKERESRSSRQAPSRQPLMKI